MNLGVKWINNSEKFIGISLTKQMEKETINYDGYIMNSDRNKSNPNILHCKDDNKNYLIDFGGAFEMLSSFYDIEGDNSLFEIPLFYDKFCFDDDYLLGDKINNVAKMNKNISYDEVLNLVDELPSEWKPQGIRDKIAFILTQRIGNREIFTK